jgi:hypothetical protein
MAYKHRIDAEREKVLAQLTTEAQENDMGYPAHEQLHGLARRQCIGFRNFPPRCV